MPNATPAHISPRRRRFVVRQRWELLNHLSELTEAPLVGLSLLWLILLVIDLTRGLSGPLLILHYVIWAIFILDFAIRFAIAPEKLPYFKKNWLTAVSLALPALRLFRALQFLRYLRYLRTLRAARSLTLVRVVSSVNRGMRATRGVLGRKRLVYIITTTLIVIATGAAGMTAFENPNTLRADGYEPAPGESIANYAEGLWWTTMIITSLGSQYWPRSSEGRILCVLLALYGFAVFGFITATISSWLVGKDTSAVEQTRPTPPAPPAVSASLIAEIATLRHEFAQLRQQLTSQSAPLPPPASPANPRQNVPMLHPHPHRPPLPHFHADPFTPFHGGL